MIPTTDHTDLLRGQGYHSRVLRQAIASAAEALDPKPSRWEQDPVGWVQTRLKEFVWSKQVDILHSVRDNRYTAVKSCHDSGKSYTASRVAAWWIDAHRPMDAFVVTTAPTWPQVQTILWREIARAHAKGDLPGRISLDAVWRLPSQFQNEIVAYGRKPQDYNPDAFQGIHQKYVLVVIDEANGVPTVLYNAIDTLVTNRYCRVLAIGNPDNPTSEFSRVCRANSGWNVIRISAFDTPAFTGEWVPDYLLDLLIGEEWVEERRARWGVRSPLWQSKVEGDFPDQSADALFPPAILYPAVNRRLRNPGTAPGTFGLDVAREGEDRSVLYRQRGGYVTEELVSYEPDTMVLADDVARTVGNKNLAIKVDATGLGGPVADRLRQLGHDAQDFVSGHSPNDPSRFDTARSEAYWHLRELMEQEAISIPDDDDLLNELGQMKYAISDRSRISVESKKDYKRRTRSPSPDKADALVYTFVDVYDYTSTDRFDFNSHKNLEHGQDAITKNAEKEGFYVGEDMVAAIGLDNIMTRPW